MLKVGKVTLIEISHMSFQKLKRIVGKTHNEDTIRPLTMSKKWLQRLDKLKYDV